MSKLAVRCAAQPPSASPGRVGVSHCHCRSEPLYSEPHSELRPYRYAAKRQPAARFAVGSPHLQHVGSAMSLRWPPGAGSTVSAHPRRRQAAPRTRDEPRRASQSMGGWDAATSPQFNALCRPPRHRLPFADGSFDVVFSCFSPSPWDEFCRVLRPGGGPPTPLHLAASLHRRTAAPLHASTAQHASAQLRALFRRDHCRARRRDPSARAARARERRRDLGGA